MSLIAGRGCRWPPRRDSVSPCAPLSGGGRDTHDGHENSPILVFFSNLLDGYLELGLLDEAIVILTADHGDNMIEHEAYFDHTYHVWDSMLRIPLMIRWPDLPGARITTPVSLVDLTPTLLDHLGLPLRPGMDGRPLEQRQFGDLLFQEAATLNRGSQPRSVIQGESKWIAFASGKREIVGNLFLNLREDPAELRVTPWPGTGSEAAAQLAELIRLDPDPGGIPEDRLAGRPLTEPKFRNELEPHEIEALRSLGYIRYGVRPRMSRLDSSASRIDRSIRWRLDQGDGVRRAPRRFADARSTVSAACAPAPEPPRRATVRAPRARVT